MTAQATTRRRRDWSRRIEARAVRRRLRSPVDQLIEIVSVDFRVKPIDLLSPFREAAQIAFARQVAMYLAHTSLGMPMHGVGRAFGRQRQTVRHACHLVEDCRDGAAFDARLAGLEAQLGARLSPAEKVAA